MQNEVSRILQIEGTEVIHLGCDHVCGQQMVHCHRDGRIPIYHTRLAFLGEVEDICHVDFVHPIVTHEVPDRFRHLRTGDEADVHLSILIGDLLQFIPVQEQGATVFEQRDYHLEIAAAVRQYDLLYRSIVDTQFREVLPRVYAGEAGIHPEEHRCELGYPVRYIDLPNQSVIINP